MTKHEDKIRLLSETPLGGAQFKQFIRRYEINIEPPPKEEEKVDKYVTCAAQYNADAHRVTRSPVGLRRWGQGRLLEVEEESYFNADDDDDDDVPVNLSNFPKTNSPSLKRKRALSVPIRSQMQRPPMPVVIPSLGSLVDYDDGEDLGGFEPAEDPPPPVSHNSSQRIQGSPGPEVPATPKLNSRPITGNNAPPPITPEDPEDSLLESLLTSSRSVGLELGAKRPRDDEDDELLAIATKAKRPTVSTAFGGAPGKEPSNGGTIAIKFGSAKTSEDGPKKIKLKLSSSSPTTPSPSSTGAKDGDTG